MDSLSSSIRSATLDLPSSSSGTKGSQAIDVNVLTDVERDFMRPWPSSYSFDFKEPEKPIKDSQPKDEQEHNFPINDNLLVGHGASACPTTEAVSPVSYPIIDLEEEASDVLFSAAIPVPPAPAPAPALPPARASAPEIVVNAPSSSLSLVNTTPVIGGTSSNNAVEENLLKELEEMGFKQVDLNKEILRMNEYNLGQSLDDLCGVAEWDPILEELQEMVTTLLLEA